MVRELRGAVLKNANFFARGKAWKAFVERALEEQGRRLVALEATAEEALKNHSALETRHKELQCSHDAIQLRHEQLQRHHDAIQLELQALESRQAVLKQAVRGMIARVIGAARSAGDLPAGAEFYCYARRGKRVRFLQFARDARPPDWVAGQPGSTIVDPIHLGIVDSIEATTLSAEGKLGEWRLLPHLLEDIKQQPEFYREVLSWFEKPTKESEVDGAVGFYEEASKALRACPDLIDFVAEAQAIVAPKLAPTTSGVPLPFDDRDELPTFAVPAEPKQRSVVFVHNSYYHFNTLAAALRQRGWDALTVSVEPHDSPQRQFYVGEDINLYHADPEIRHRQIRRFLQNVPERFGVLHFCGQGQPSLFAENFDNSAHRTKVPWDFLELRRHNMTIGYSPSGCLDGARQSSIRRISQNVCGRCVWELRPDICCDARSGAWAETLDMVCDWVGLEGDWAVDDRCGPKYVRGPLIYTLDPNYWHPDLQVEEGKRVVREPGDILVYHAVGNSKARQANGRDIKGTRAVEVAIGNLKAEGIPIKLFFASDLHISEVRYYKVQADIVIDQLNYGRIGANARESFMLGKPVITRLMPEQSLPLPPLRSVGEAPALDATEETVETVLRNLALDPEMRNQISVRSRQYALKWFASDVCARRFEMVIDRVRAGLPAETDELYPPPDELEPD